MFTTSETTQKICKALLAAQAELPIVQKDSTNPFLHNRYASLGAIWKTIQPILAKHALAVLQSPGEFVNGAISITTRLIHESGEWYESTVSLPVDKMTPQGVGAAITYGKRYALSAFLGIITDEDTDGHSPPAPPTQQPRKTTSAPPATVTKY